MALHAEELLLRASRHPLASACAEGLCAAGVGPDDRLLLGVSGGADSMAMLVLVAAVRRRTDAGLSSLAVLACDHGLRPEAQAECETVLAMCRELGVARASSVRLEVSRAGNTLAAAREARLRALWDGAASGGAATVLVAHHADDVAEGVLIALARGEGLDSLQSLVPRREFPGGFALCRPLLAVRRAELRSMLIDLGVRWHEDPSNGEHARGAMRSDKATRDLLDRIASGSGALVREARELIALRDLLASRLVEEGVRRIDRERLEQAPVALRAAAIVRLARGADGALARSVVDAAARAIDDGDRRPRVYAGKGGALHLSARAIEWIPGDPTATAD